MALSCCKLLVSAIRTLIAVICAGVVTRLITTPVEAFIDEGNVSTTNGQGVRSNVAVNNGGSIVVFFNMKINATVVKSVDCFRDNSNR